MKKITSQIKKKIQKILMYQTAAAVESKIVPELLKQNELYVTQDAHWQNIEQNHDFLLQEFIHFTAPDTLGQPAQEDVWKNLKNQPKREDVKREYKSCHRFLTSLLEKKKLGPTGADSNVYKYIQKCLTNIAKTYEAMENQLETARFAITTLHKYHEDLLRDKFRKAFDTLQKEHLQNHQEYMNLKSQWTLNTQEALSKWDQQYKTFVQNLLTWIDGFFYHQKAIILLGGKGILPHDSYQVLETIFIRTEKIKLQALDQKSQQNSYIPFLLTLYQCWTKIETKHQSLIKKEIHNLDLQCQQKYQQMKKQKMVVDKYQDSVRCLEEESDHLYNVVLQDQSQLTELQLRSSISLKKKLEHFKPKLLNHRHLLQQYLNEWTELEEKRKIFQRPLPEVRVLQELKTQETLLLEKQQFLQNQSTRTLEELNVASKQRISMQLENFHHYLARNAELAHKERRLCEWKQWGLLESYLRTIEPRLIMLQNNMLQFRDECTSLFSVDEFAALKTHFEQGWSSIINSYVETRIETQANYLYQLIQFFITCHEQLKSLK